MIAMGISLVSEQLKMKFASDGAKGNMDRYILKKHFGVRETPADKTGSHNTFGGKKNKQDKMKTKKSGEQEFTDMAAVDNRDWEDQVLLG